VHTRCVVGENFVSPQCSVSMRLTHYWERGICDKACRYVVGWLVGRWFVTNRKTYLRNSKSSKFPIFVISLPLGAHTFKPFKKNLALGKNPRSAPSRKILPLSVQNCGLNSQNRSA